MDTLITTSWFLVLLILGVQGYDKSRPLIVTTIVDEPFMMISNDTSLEGNDRFEGFIADILKEIAKETDLVFEIFPVNDGKYGQLDPTTNQWSGMIGELTQRQADMAAAPLTRTKIREEAVDFTYPIMSAKMTALVHKDVEADTIEDLIENPDITFGVIENGATETALRSSQDPVYSKIWPRVSPETGYLNNAEEAASQARKGNFAFIGEEAFNDYQASKPPCNLMTTSTFDLGEEVPTYNFAVSKDDILKNVTEAVTKAIQKLDENQKIRDLYTHWFVQAGKCSGCLSASTLSITMLISTLVLSLQKYL